MEQTAMTVRMDKQLKIQFEELCKEFGMSINTAFNIFVHAVVNHRSIPFEIKDVKATASVEAMKAFEAIRKSSADVPNMTLDEINAEIAAARSKRTNK